MQSGDSSLQIYSDLLAQKQAELPTGTLRSPEQFLAALRNRLEAIEDLLAVKVRLRDLTEKSISRLESDIRTIIIAGIRNTPTKVIQQYIEASEAVMINLFGASDELNKALEELEKRGKTDKYFKHLRACQTYLKKALDKW